MRNQGTEPRLLHTVIVAVACLFIGVGSGWPFSQFGDSDVDVLDHVLGCVDSGRGCAYIEVYLDGERVECREDTPESVYHRAILIDRKTKTMVSAKDIPRSGLFSNLVFSVLGAKGKQKWIFEKESNRTFVVERGKVVGLYPGRFHCPNYQEGPELRAKYLIINRWLEVLWQIAPFLGLIVIVADTFLVFVLVGRGRKLLQVWAAENGREVLRAEYRWLRRGPFSWTTTRAQSVFFVKFARTEGVTEYGWICVGYLWNPLAKKIKWVCLPQKLNPARFEANNR